MLVYSPVPRAFTVTTCLSTVTAAGRGSIAARGSRAGGGATGRTSRSGGTAAGGADTAGRPTTASTRERVEACDALDVAGRETGQHTDGAGTDDPVLKNDVPVADILPVEIECNGLALSRLQEDLLKAAEHLHGGEVLIGRLREPEVELRYCCTCNGASV